MTSRCFECWIGSLLTAATLSGFSNQSRSDEPSGLHARFLSTAPQEWEKYRVRGKRLQGSYLLNVKMHDDRDRAFRVRYEVKHNSIGASYLIQKLGDEKDSTGKVTVVNPRYGFKLQRSTHASDWIVAGMNLNLKDGYKLDSIAPDLFAKDFVNRAFNFSVYFSMSHSLPELMKDPAFSVTNVTWSASQTGDKFVRVDFRNHPHLVKDLNFEQNDLPNEWIDLVEGSVLLDPDHYWVFREFHVINEWQNRTKGTMDARFEYKLEQDGFPILTRIDVQYKRVSTRGITAEHKGTLEFDLIQQDLPDSEFTLSAYGFPEPVSPQPRIPLYVWVALAGLLCLVSGGLVRWWFRQGRNARDAQRDASRQAGSLQPLPPRGDG